MKPSCLIGAFACGAALVALAIAPSGASAGWTELCSNQEMTKETFVRFEDLDCKVRNEMSGTKHKLVTGGEIWTHIFTGKGAQRFSGTSGGVAIEVSCNGIANTSGIAENIEVLTLKEVSGHNMVIVYSECTVTAPAGKSCKVSESITTRSLKTLALEIGGQDKVKFEPEEGTTIAEFTLSGCSVSALNKTYVLSGSFTGLVPNEEQSLIEFTSAIKESATLKLSGVTAGYIGGTSAEKLGTTERIFIGL